jgi:hypothetical protein
MNRLLPVIGVTGKINTGKDTAGDVLKNLGCISFSFADPLKLCVQELFGFSYESLWGPSECRTSEVRKVLQELGTDICRKYRPTIWVDKMRDRLNLCRNEGLDYYNMIPEEEIEKATGIVITDVRFPNEAEMLVRDMNAFLIRVHRPNNYAHTEHSASRHESETAQDLISLDHIGIDLHNIGTLAEFQLAVRTVGEEIIK